MSSEVRTPKRLEDADKEILKILREGRFTPFLGAGASSLRAREFDLESKPWREILSATVAIDKRFSSQSAEHLYVRSFAQQRLNLNSQDLERYLSIQGSAEGFEGQSWQSVQLVDLQCAVVSLATFLGDLFGSSISQSHYSIITTDCALSIEPSEEVEKALAVLLFNAVDAAAELAQRKEIAWGGPNLSTADGIVGPFLEADKIYEKLVHLTRDIVNQSIWQSSYCIVWRAKHLSLESASYRARSIIKTITIRFENLAWLSDLLWYTIRFWSPCFPTTSELASELALISFETPPRKAELAQAAEAISDEDDDELARHLGELFSYYQSVSEAGPFHLAIAAALHYTFFYYAAQLDQFSESTHITDEENEAGTTYCLPIAFTTNFDREIERALEKLDVSYHVIYPVRACSIVNKEKKYGEVKWRFKTIYKRGKSGEFPSAGNCKDLSDSGHGENRFIGPIIVKLHGSPLDELKKNEVHWLVLAESGYLEAMIGKGAALPDWIEAQLRASRPQRSLWFLGYSVADWNIRMRLYEHLHHSLGQDNKHQAPVRNVIDRNLGDFRVAIFPRLGIQPFVGDLNDLPEILYKSLREISRKHDMSPEVLSYLRARESRRK